MPAVTSNHLLASQRHHIYNRGRLLAISCQFSGTSSVKMKQRAGEAVMLVVVGLLAAAGLCTAEIAFNSTEDEFTISFQGELVSQ